MLRLLLLDGSWQPASDPLLLLGPKGGRLAARVPAELFIVTWKPMSPYTGDTSGTGNPALMQAGSAAGGP